MEKLSPFIFGLVLTLTSGLLIIELYAPPFRDGENLSIFVKADCIDQAAARTTFWTGASRDVFANISILRERPNLDGSANVTRQCSSLEIRSSIEAACISNDPFRRECLDVVHRLQNHSSGTAWTYTLQNEELASFRGTLFVEFKNVTQYESFSRTRVNASVGTFALPSYVEFGIPKESNLENIIGSSYGVRENGRRLVFPPDPRQQATTFSAAIVYSRRQSLQQVLIVMVSTLLGVGSSLMVEGFLSRRSAPDD